MEKEKDQEVEAIIQALPPDQTFILRDILEAEKSLLNRESLQGTGIVNQIMNIVKERVNL